MSGLRPAGPGTARRERGQATPSVVAVASVVALIVALVAFFAGGNSDDVTVQPTAQEEPAAASPAPTPAPTAAGTPDKRRQGRDGAGGSQQGRDRGGDRAAVDSNAPEVYVEVYNNSSVSGLAGSTAAELQDAGWEVVGVDNWHGVIPQSTVYHPAGMAAEAKRLARELGIDRVRGAVEPMKFDRLTVILTADAA